MTLCTKRSAEAELSKLMRMTDSDAHLSSNVVSVSVYLYLYLFLHERFDSVQVLVSF